MAEVGIPVNFNPSGYVQLAKYLVNLIQHPSQIFITNPLQSLEQLFEGRPRQAATVAAVLRLGSSKNPVIKGFGKDLATLERGGVILSSSDPTARANLNKIYAKAVAGLEAQGTPKHQANAILDLILRGAQGSAFNALFTPPPNQPPPISGPPAPPPSQPPPVIMPPPVIPVTGPVSVAPGFGGGQPPPIISPPSQPPPSPQTSFPGQQSQLGNFLNQVSSRAQNIVKDVIPGLRELESLTGQTIDIFKPPPSIQDTLNKGPLNISGQTGNVPSIPPPPNTTDTGWQLHDFSRGSIPVANWRSNMVINPQDCPDCNPQQYRERMQSQQDQDNIARILKNQQGDLQQSIQTEQSQSRSKKLSEQERQIEQFQKSETDDSLTSQQIDQQVQQKMQLLDQIGHELQVLDQMKKGGGGASNTSALPSPSPSGTPTGEGYSIDSSGVITPTGQSGKGTLTEPQQEQQEEAIFYQQHPDANAMDERDPTKAVKFCVACVTEHDARLFLNGEPSACSVIPYPDAFGVLHNG